MTTERKSLLAMFLAWLTQGQTPVDGIHFWEPTGALKFTTPQRPADAKAPRGAATASYRACAL